MCLTKPPGFDALAEGPIDEAGAIGAYYASDYTSCRKFRLEFYGTRNRHYRGTLMDMVCERMGLPHKAKIVKKKKGGA